MVDWWSTMIFPPPFRISKEFVLSFWLNERANNQTEESCHVLPKAFLVRNWHKLMCLGLGHWRLIWVYNVSIYDASLGWYQLLVLTKTIGTLDTEYIEAKQQLERSLHLLSSAIQHPSFIRPYRKFWFQTLKSIRI